MTKAQLITEPASSTGSTLECALANGEKRRAEQACCSLVMLVGRQDKPTDAVRDYGSRLTEALTSQGIACETWDLRWDEQGWIKGLAALWMQSRAWAGRWVVLQYTALMWSRRGFPVSLPLVLKILRIRGCRVAVMFHDVYAVPASRWIDRIRVFLQEQIMRHLAVNASRAILPVALQRISWLPLRQGYCEFIPVGANVPSVDELRKSGYVVQRHKKIPTVAVFGIPTWPAAQAREVTAIIGSVRKASLQTGDLQLLVLGRGAKEAESLLRSGLSGTAIKLQVVGLRSGAEISAALCSSDVFLFVRGGLSTRRGSGLAALACGLPIVAYRGEETGPSLTEAGIAFAPEGDVELLGDELARVLLDHDLRLHMAERNLTVFRQWFSWDRIASRWVDVLGLHEGFSQ
jgi:glycosyltransferase involved in cell wall biosynthesis